MDQMHPKFLPRPLGLTGFPVSRLGVGSSFKIGAAGMERAFASGVNYFYWGSLRRDGFAEGIRRIAARREQFFLVIQSYSRLGLLLRPSLERALRRLQLDYADMLLLGLWNKPVPARILDAAVRLRDSGLVRHLGVSSHRRATFTEHRATGQYSVFHVRYNAAHPGAERDVFPLLPAENRPGIATFTTTSWGQLLDPRYMPPGENPPTSTDCYRFAMTHPDVDVALCGPANDDQLDLALRALALGPLQQEEMARVRRIGEHVYRTARPRFR